MHLSAAAAMTPSGVPPMPNSTSTPESGHAVAIAAATSPSPMSRMREPVSRISATRSSWRGRSRTVAVTSVTAMPFAAAIARRLSATEASMSTTPAASGPTAIFSM